MYCDVLLLNQESNYDQVLTYLVPTHWTNFQVGLLVSVPVRQNKQRGLVLLVHEQKPQAKIIKELDMLLYPLPVITKQGLELAHWLSRYYVCSLNKAVHLFLIPQIRQAEKIYLLPGPKFHDQELLVGAGEGEILELMRENQGGLPLAKVRRTIGPAGEQALKYLLKADYLRVEKVFNTRVKEKQAFLIKLTEQSPRATEVAKKSPRQAQVIEYLTSRDSVPLLEIKKELGEITSAITSLKKKGWIEIISESAQRDPLAIRLESHRPTVLNEEQNEAAAKICGSISNREEGRWLLYGVTGSGKTEVFLQAIAETLRQGRQVLYLVPEIALTPQITAVLLEAFGGQVAILHSSLSAGERYDEWVRISAGQARVIVGPRSAVFAPFLDLGLLIVDEEHENTYKQSEPDPRYDARTVVLELARIFGAVVVMGSATPSLTRLHSIELGQFNLLRLTRRVASRPMPEIRIIDMKEQLQLGNTGLFSSPLIAALEKVLTAGEQAILFINRRGYNTFVLCRECGTALSCPHCAITLTYHHARQKLVCHYCNYMRNLPSNCPACGSRFIRYLGSGTERVAMELASLFPEARILRMDADTTREKGSHTNILKEFQEGKGQILVGTQMIAKGLDFPAVTLVGIVNPDTLINMPDFQAGERAFQLLSQVSGRAGRGDLPGEVLIQTFNPDNYLFPAMTINDYAAFSNNEMANRELLQYPPFWVLARVLVSGTQEKNVTERVDYLAKMLKIEIDKLAEHVEILGPSPAPLHFIKGRYRYHLILKSEQVQTLQTLAYTLKEHLLKMTPEPRVIIDIEAQTLL